MSTNDSCQSYEIMLFGVRVMVDPMRKSVSLNDLSDYEDFLTKESHAGVNVPVYASGYHSADNASVPNKGSGGSRKRKQGMFYLWLSGGSRKRKQGVPWTEEEHKLFLFGLQKVGKGDWRGISRYYVKSRTATQVASHAQKYFLRQSNGDSCRRRCSLFDITTESVTSMEKRICQEHKAQPLLPVAEVLLVPTQTRAVEIDLNQKSAENLSPLSLDLTLSFDHVEDQFSINSADMITVA